MIKSKVKRKNSMKNVINIISVKVLKDKIKIEYEDKEVE